MRNLNRITGWIFLLASVTLQGQNTPVKQVMEVPAGYCVTEAEWRLYRMINEYRREYDLSPVPLSLSLSFVARTHVKDLLMNHPDQEPCNSHSWSDKGPWKPFCYPGDENKKGSVWDKPKELSAYRGKGYEIIYWENDTVHIDSVMALWKTIDYFNSFLMNNGKWQGKRWNAIGIGIFQNYAAAWFGEVPDPDGVPPVCGKNIERNIIASESTQVQKEPVSETVVSPPAAKPEKPASPAATTAPSPGKYYIIVRSQLPLADAVKVAESLVAKGFTEARVLQFGGKVRVAISEALNREQANAKLSEARKLYKDAWILTP